MTLSHSITTVPLNSAAPAGRRTTMRVRYRVDHVLHEHVGAVGGSGLHRYDQRRPWPVLLLDPAHLVQVGRGGQRAQVDAVALRQRPVELGRPLGLIDAADGRSRPRRRTSACDPGSSPDQYPPAAASAAARARDTPLSALCVLSFPRSAFTPGDILAQRGEAATAGQPNGMNVPCASVASSVVPRPCADTVHSRSPMTSERTIGGV